MIVFDLECRAAGHRFEGWFGSSEDFAAQQERGLVCCPQCGSYDVAKALMAPNLGRKGNQIAAPSEKGKRSLAGGKIPPEAVEMIQALSKMQAEALKDSRWVGEEFAEQSRKQHYGEAEQETIHGQATLEQAKDLFEEGIEVFPLPFLVVPPDQSN